MRKSLLLACLLLAPALHAETVHKCQTESGVVYQSAPCEPDKAVKQINTQLAKPDQEAIDRLEQQRLSYLSYADPAEFRRLQREKMTPDQRAADERLEREQQFEAEKLALELRQREIMQQQTLSQMEAQRQDTLRIETQRLAIERQRLARMRGYY
jgi:hypothetical protein